MGPAEPLKLCLAAISLVIAHRWTPHDASLLDTDIVRTKHVAERRAKDAAVNVERARRAQVARNAALLSVAAGRDFGGSIFELLRRQCKFGDSLVVARESLDAIRYERGEHSVGSIGSRGAFYEVIISGDDEGNR